MNAFKAEEIGFQADGNPVSGYLARPEHPAGGILLLHAWWGLNPFFKQFCERLAGEDFVVFAPDLYQGKIASTIAEAEKIMGEQKLAWTSAAVLGSADFLRQQPGVTGKLGVVGFSMGASWALWLSSVKPETIAAVSLYYGVEGIDFSPVKAVFQGHFAEVDEWTPDEDLSRMESAMHASGLKTEFYHYPGTGHWFVEADRPDAYRPEAAALAWKRTVHFFKNQIIVTQPVQE